MKTQTRLHLTNCWPLTHFGVAFQLGKHSLRSWFQDIFLCMFLNHVLAFAHLSKQHLFWDWLETCLLLNPNSVFFYCLEKKWSHVCCWSSDCEAIWIKSKASFGWTWGSKTVYQFNTRERRPGFSPSRSWGECTENVFCPLWNIRGWWDARKVAWTTFLVVLTCPLERTYWA